MDVAIGIQFAPRELRLDIDQPAEEVRALLDKAFEDAAKVLWLTDRKGRQVAVPLDKLAYVEIDADANERRVGFSVAAESKED